MSIKNVFFLTLLTKNINFSHSSPLFVFSLIDLTILTISTIILYRSTLHKAIIMLNKTSLIIRSYIIFDRS